VQALGTKLTVELASPLQQGATTEISIKCARV